MATQETPSRNRKRRRFLFDDIESDVLSDGDDNIIAGVPQEKLFSFDVGTTTRGPPRFGITSKTSGITGINQGIMELWESEAESTL